MKRSKELLLRWAEMEVFTPYMRTHEGNRPLSNWQAYSDNDTLERLAKLTKIHISLKPYIKNAVNENARLGYPVIRPLMLHYDESWCYREETEFLLGRDLLVCPVLKKGVTTRNVRLPMDEWINLFTKERFKKGEYTISCPLGSIPVFYRKGSEFENLFQSFNS